MIQTPGPWDETVVLWVLGGRVKDAVEDKGARLLVELVFVFAASRDFNAGEEALWFDSGTGYCVKDVHYFYLHKGLYND